MGVSSGKPDESDKTRHGRPALWRYADAHRLGGGWVTEARRMGQWDADIDVWLERQKPEHVEAARAAPVVTRKTYAEAVAVIISTLAISPEHDTEGFIAQMDVDEDVRERLRQRFLGARVESAGRAPPVATG